MVFAHLLNITHHVAQHAERVTNGAWQNSKDFCFWDSELIELDGLYDNATLMPQNPAYQ